MKIVTIPHPSLRQVAQEVTRVDAALSKFVSDLQTTLNQTRQPRGVGLAAPQVDKLWRVFATNLPPINLPPRDKLTGDKIGSPGDRPLGQSRYFINPRIVRACKRKKVLGVNPRDPDLEGCLSMPGLYGPVPRQRWVEIEYQTLDDDQLIAQRERFDGFAARVIQHELDHLDGILFTDYALANRLPVYRQNDSDQLVEIDRELIEVL